MMKRVEMNEEMMMNVNGGLIVVDRDNPRLPENTVPVVLDDTDPVIEYGEKLLDAKTYVKFIKDLLS